MASHTHAIIRSFEELVPGQCLTFVPAPGRLLSVSLFPCEASQCRAWHLSPVHLRCLSLQPTLLCENLQARTSPHSDSKGVTSFGFGDLCLGSATPHPQANKIINQIKSNPKSQLWCWSIGTMTRVFMRETDASGAKHSVDERNHPGPSACLSGCRIEPRSWSRAVRTPVFSEGCAQGRATSAGEKKEGAPCYRSTHLELGLAAGRGQGEKC